MANYRLEIQYDGTRYNGWQKQPDTNNTIQGKIEDVFSRMAPDQPYPIQLISAGRTDAGVHARCQVANIHLETPLSCEDIRTYLNRYLPEDIGIVSVSPAGERFHARLNASGKTYCYRVALDPALHILERRYMTPISEIISRLEANARKDLPFPPTEPAFLRLSTGDFDLSSMQAAADLLVGTHDFGGFTSRRMKKSTVRTIKQISIEELPGELRLSFTGDGFLYNMVRILTGTLWEAAFHLRDAASVDRILHQADRTFAGFTAPARGLILTEVYYS